MTWFRIDDSFYDHPKVADLPDSALALWVRAGTYAARHLTDGFVSRRLADRLCDRPDEAIPALLKSGLWIEDPEGGFRFHDWSVYQPTAAEAKAARDARSVGGAVGNHERWHVGKGRIDPKCAYCRSSDRVADRSSDRVPDQVAEGVPESEANRMRIPRPVPTRPDPVKSKSVSAGFDLSLTKQDHEKGSNQNRDDGLTDDERMRRQWRGVDCPEHRGVSIVSCYQCGIEHKSASYWTRQDRSKWPAK